ncbi:hypothetical protein MSAN_00680300 [Mycena sanguinolenta]|uniref:Uncharacterized protein n=1 Tax=Mycena sanguinolenta TaxID=230812 RepID=A0A8H6Z0N4_9AGAR|nr:hypothetical protein MSAN_00680300 [Mycena sanguinolenta]
MPSCLLWLCWNPILPDLSPYWTVDLATIPVQPMALSSVPVWLGEVHLISKAIKVMHGVLKSMCTFVKSNFKMKSTLSSPSPSSRLSLRSTRFFLYQPLAPRPGTMTLRHGTRLRRNQLVALDNWLKNDSTGKSLHLLDRNPGIEEALCVVYMSIAKGAVEGDFKKPRHLPFLTQHGGCLISQAARPSGLVHGL